MAPDSQFWRVLSYDLCDCSWGLWLLATPGLKQPTCTLSVSAGRLLPRGAHCRKRSSAATGSQGTRGAPSGVSDAVHFPDFPGESLTWPGPCLCCVVACADRMWGGQVDGCGDLESGTLWGTLRSLAQDGGGRGGGGDILK